MKMIDVDFHMKSFACNKSISRHDSPTKQIHIFTIRPSCIEDSARVIEMIEASQRKTGLDLRPLIMNQLEWLNLEQKSPEFFDELSHGLILWEKPVEESRL